MNYIKLLLLSVLISTSALAQSNAAAPGSKLQVKLDAYKVVVENNEERLLKTDTAAPGDIILYKAVYQNVSNELLKDIKVTLPIPKQLAYINKSALPSNPKVSVDGTNFFSPNLEEAEQNSEEFKFLSWEISQLTPGEERVYQARTQLD